jgi:hypothetical protein
MKKTRFAAKAFAGTLVATVLVLGSVSAPAQARPDTGWGVTSQVDTGWGVTTKTKTAKGDTGWG